MREKEFNLATLSRSSTPRDALDSLSGRLPPSGADRSEQVFPGVARIIVDRRLTGQVNAELNDITAGLATSAKCLWVMSDKPYANLRRTRNTVKHFKQRTN